jgi:pimeloyl-ACP methyl ester carboxylesterase
VNSRGLTRMAKNLRMDAATTEADKETNHPPAPERLAEPINMPDSVCNEDWLVFLHGYNVNGRQARGWHSEAFKRFFWSGSKAKFVGVSWYGDQTQIQAIGVTPKYYENVENALNNAGYLRTFVNNLVGGKKYVAAHSLGGLVTSYAIAREGMQVEKAFLFDPALPTEALLPGGAKLDDLHIEPMAWRPYPEDIKASEWHALFPGSDARAALTWRGLVHAAVPKLKIFFSEGEEVLAAMPLNYVADPGHAIGPPTGQYAFCIQAMLKGEEGMELTSSLAFHLASSFLNVSPASAHGGWRRTIGTGQPAYGTIQQIPDTSTFEYQFEPPQWFENRLSGAGGAAFRERLRTGPFFGTTTPTNCTGLFHEIQGHDVAATNWKARRILGQMIPERTLPAGGAGGSGVAGAVDSLVTKFESNNLGTIQTFDMQANRNGWPASRPAIRVGNGWRHSDIREVAYVHVWKAWQQIVNDGNLQQDPPNQLP